MYEVPRWCLKDLINLRLAKIEKERKKDIKQKPC